MNRPNNGNLGHLWFIPPICGEIGDGLLPSYQHTAIYIYDTVCTTYHDISRISNLHFGVFNFPLCWLKKSMHTPLSHHTWYSPRRDSIISARHGEVICVYGAPRTWPRWWTSLMISWHVGGHVFSPFFTRPQKSKHVDVVALLYSYYRWCP